MTGSVLVATENADDLADPRCARHWNAAVGVVTFETPDDHERREVFCPECAWTVQSEAMLAAKDAFTPPVISPISLDLYRPFTEAVSA